MRPLEADAIIACLHRHDVRYVPIGASSHRTSWRPSPSHSPSASARAFRSATSSTETIAAMRPQSGGACGATARNSLSAPHSSASKCEKPMRRNRYVVSRDGQRFLVNVVGTALEPVQPIEVLVNWLPAKP